MGVVPPPLDGRWNPCQPKLVYLPHFAPTATWLDCNFLVNGQSVDKEGGYSGVVLNGPSSTIILIAVYAAQREQNLIPINIKMLLKIKWTVHLSVNIITWKPYPPLPLS